MAGRSGPLVVWIAVAIGLVIGTASLLFTVGGAPRPPRSREAPSGASDSSGSAAPPSGAAPPAPAPSLAPTADPVAISAPAAGSVGPTPAPPLPLPDEGPDAASWRSTKVAFRPRELGRLGASVKVGLDAARRDMDFCFRKADRGAADPAPRASGDGRREPAILLLYLEAREGAVAVVDTRTDYLGDATPELVECCREVLRGWEIPAFDAVPGRRYRLKFQLE